MQEIIKPFEYSLFDKNIKDIGIDMFEFGIDSLLKEGTIRDLPIVGTIVSTGQFIYNLYDRNLLRQTLLFIQQFNANEIDPIKLKKYKESLKKDFSKAEKELGRVLIFLNKIIDSEKSTILAKLYSAYINQNISWEDFCEFSEVNDRLFIKDIRILFDLYNHYSSGIDIERQKDYIYQRLISIGLLKNDVGIGPLTFAQLEGESEKPVHVELTQLGYIFCENIK